MKICHVEEGDMKAQLMISRSVLTEHIATRATDKVRLFIIN